MYNSTSINDGLQFINQSSTRINKTCNKYKNKNKKELILDNDDEIIENFVVDDTAITVKNINETNTMNTNIVGYNNSMNDLNSIQNSITKQSKIFLDINKKIDNNITRDWLERQQEKKDNLEKEKYKMEIEKSQIEAARQVAIAYASGTYITNNYTANSYSASYNSGYYTTRIYDALIW